MALFTGTQQQYYSGARKTFTGDGATQSFTIANNLTAFNTNVPNLPPSRVKIYFDGVLQDVFVGGLFTYSLTHDTTSGWHVFFATAPANGVVIEIEHKRTNFGGYQFTSLNNVIAQFMFAYVGEDKIISKTKKMDVAFHAQRAMQELSFDTFKSCKAQEIEVPAFDVAEMSWGDIHNFMSELEGE